MRNNFYFLMLFASIFISQQVGALTYTATVPADTKACYITGDAAGGWGTWVKMEKVDATTYTVTLATTNEAAEYKYFSGPDWKYEEASDAAGTGLAANRKWSDHSGKDEVLFWKEVFVPEIKNLTIDCWVPSEAHELYITGSFNSWSGKFGEDQKMTFVGAEDGGKVFTYALTTDNPGGLAFKFIAGPDWAYEQTSKDNFTLALGNEYEPNKYAYSVSEFKEFFDPALAGYITITATVPATENVWIQGSLFGWNWDGADAQLMSKNTDGTFSYTTFRPVQSMEYRLYNRSDWGNPEQEYDEVKGWVEKSNRHVNFATSGANVSITVCKWTNDEGGVLCGPGAGVNDVKPDYFKVYPENGSLVVEGALNRVEIYDLSGRDIENTPVIGKYVSPLLNKGIYIIKVDGNARKALVK